MIKIYYHIRETHTRNINDVCMHINSQLAPAFWLGVERKNVGNKYNASNMEFKTEQSY